MVPINPQIRNSGQLGIQAAPVNSLSPSCLWANAQISRLPYKKEEEKGQIPPLKQKLNLEDFPGHSGLRGRGAFTVWRIRSSVCFIPPPSEEWDLLIAVRRLWNSSGPVHNTRLCGTSLSAVKAGVQCHFVGHKSWEKAMSLLLTSDFNMCSPGIAITLEPEDNNILYCWHDCCILISHSPSICHQAFNGEYTAIKCAKKGKDQGQIISINPLLIISQNVRLHFPVISFSFLP